MHVLHSLSVHPNTPLESPVCWGIAQDPQGGIALAQGLLAAGDVAEELRQNVALEQQLHNEFLLAVRSKLDPLQSATAIVHVRSKEPRYKP